MSKESEKFGDFKSYNIKNTFEYWTDFLDTAGHDLDAVFSIIELASALNVVDGPDSEEKSHALVRYAVSIFLENGNAANLFSRIDRCINENQRVDKIVLASVAVDIVLDRKVYDEVIALYAFLNENTQTLSHELLIWWLNDTFKLMVSLEDTQEMSVTRGNVQEAVSGVIDTDKKEDG